MLGRTPRECRKGSHDENWRKKVDDRLAELAQRAVDQDRARETADLLGDLHFGFAHIGRL